MDFKLSDEQAAFRALIRDFAQRAIKPVAHAWGPSGRCPTEIVEQMREPGLYGLLAPEEYGGAGVDAVSYAIVFEELARAWMGISGIIGTHSMATLLLARFGTEAQKQRWLTDLASGARRSGLALTEPGAGSDLQSISTVAIRDGDGGKSANIVFDDAQLEPMAAGILAGIFAAGGHGVGQPLPRGDFQLALRWLQGERHRGGQSVGRRVGESDGLVLEQNQLDEAIQDPFVIKV